MGGEGSATGRRDDAWLVGAGGSWSVSGGEPVNLGFNGAEAGKQRGIFASQLLAIGNVVNALQGDPPAGWQAAIDEAAEGLPGNTDAFIEKLAPVLTLAPSSKAAPNGIRDQLSTMRDCGTALWNQLDPDLKKQLQDYGIQDSSVPTQEDNQAQLAVQLPQQGNDPPAPICWNMVYQEDENHPKDPWQFWGFRVAISQWPQLGRENTIKVRPALTAADGTLPFACKEARLVKAFAGDADCRALECELQAAAAAVLGSLPDESKLPLGEQTWLGKFLLDDDPQYDQTAERMPDALIDTITDIFKQPFGLIHFSCHCEPAGAWDPALERNPPERRLQMTVAGGTIRLDQTFVINKLSYHKGAKIERKDPGGLVFLNACGTGQQVSGQFPDLPYTWIRFRGAKAVVATLCEVPDIFAYAFALKLYQILGEAQKEYLKRQEQSLKNPGLIPQPPQNLYLDSALLTTRRFFMQKFNNPLGLAYELYAVKGARLEPALGGGDS